MAAEMKTLEILIAIPLGLHVRPAAMITKINSDHQANSFLSFLPEPAEEDKYPCYSVMKLAAMEAGKGRTIYAHSESEEALNWIKEVLTKDENAVKAAYEDYRKKRGLAG